MRLRILLVVPSILTIGACQRNSVANSGLTGVVAGNSKAVYCQYPHQLLGGKRIEQRAVYEARKLGLTPMAVEAKSTVEQERLLAESILATIKDKDPLYYGLMREFVANFDNPEKKIVNYEFAVNIEDAKSQEGPVVLPADGFLETDATGPIAAFNPLYDKPRCQTQSILLRETTDISETRYTVVKDRWNVDFVREFLAADSRPDALHPELDFLDATGRVAAKLEEALDTLETGSAIANIRYIAHLVAGHFANMPMHEYAAWKDRLGLSTTFSVDLPKGAYLHLEMESLQYFPAEQGGGLRSADIARRSATAFQAQGAWVRPELAGQEYHLGFSWGSIDFNPDGSIKSIFGHLRSEHHEVGRGRCSIHMAGGETGTFWFEGNAVTKIEYPKLDLYGCIDSPRLPEKARSVQLTPRGDFVSFEPAER